MTRKCVEYVKRKVNTEAAARFWPGSGRNHRCRLNFAGAACGSLFKYMCSMMCAYLIRKGTEVLVPAPVWILIFFPYNSSQKFTGKPKIWTCLCVCVDTIRQHFRWIAKWWNIKTHRNRTCSKEDWMELVKRQQKKYFPKMDLWKNKGKTWTTSQTNATQNVCFVKRVASRMQHFLPRSSVRWNICFLFCHVGGDSGAEWYLRYGLHFILFFTHSLWSGNMLNRASSFRRIKPQISKRAERKELNKSIFFFPFNLRKWEKKVEISIDCFVHRNLTSQRERLE